MSQSSPWKNEKTPQTPSATKSQAESATNNKICILLEILNSLKIRLKGASKRERGKNKTKPDSARTSISYHLWEPATSRDNTYIILWILPAPARVGVLTLRTEKLRLRDPRDLPRVTQLISGQVEIGIQISLYSPWFCCYALWIYKSISPEYLQCILNVEIVAGLGTGIFRSSPVDFKVQ